MEPQNTTIKVTKQAGKKFTILKAELFETSDNASSVLLELMKNYRENNK
jgi:hypothetical protein